MIIFETLKYFFRILGYLKPNLPERFRDFPIHILQRITIYIGLISGLIPIINFMIFEAESFKEIASVYPYGAGVFLCLGIFSILLFIKSDILELINDLEDIIRQSKWQKCSKFILMF